MTDCPCPDWQANAPKIDNAIMGMYVHGARGEAVQLTPLRFCPWCGGRIEEAVDEALGDAG